MPFGACRKFAGAQRTRCGQVREGEGAAEHRRRNARVETGDVRAGVRLSREIGFGAYRADGEDGSPSAAEKAPTVSASTRRKSSEKFGEWLGPAFLQAPGTHQAVRQERRGPCQSAFRVLAEAIAVAPGAPMGQGRATSGSVPGGF